MIPKIIDIKTFKNNKRAQLFQNKSYLNNFTLLFNKKIYNKIILPDNMNINSLITRKDYKTPAKEILNESSLQFLLRPIKSQHSIVKIIWFIFLIVFLFLTVFLCIQSIQSYLAFETITSIYEIEEKETEFPAISICNPNILSFSITVLDLRFNGFN